VKNGQPSSRLRPPEAVQLLAGVVLLIASFLHQFAYQAAYSYAPNYAAWHRQTLVVLLAGYLAGVLVSALGVAAPLGALGRIRLGSQFVFGASCLVVLVFIGQLGQWHGAVHGGVGLKIGLVAALALCGGAAWRWWAPVADTTEAAWIAFVRDVTVFDVAGQASGVLQPGRWYLRTGTAPGWVSVQLQTGETGYITDLSALVKA
jgi:hypothetical protein